MSVSWDPYKDFRIISTEKSSTTVATPTTWYAEERRAEPMLAVKRLEDIVPNGISTDNLMFDWAETEKILLFSQAIIWLLLLLILVALFAVCCSVTKQGGKEYKRTEENNLAEPCPCRSTPV